MVLASLKAITFGKTKQNKKTADCLFLLYLLSQSFVAEAMLIMVTVLHLGKSSLPKKPITDDDVDRISLCLKVLSECSPLMNDIFNKECRKSLSHMLAVRLEEEKLSQKVKTVLGTAEASCQIEKNYRIFDFIHIS